MAKAPNVTKPEAPAVETVEAKPEVVTPKVIIQDEPVVILDEVKPSHSARTLAEMEAGRSALAKHAEREAKRA